MLFDRSETGFGKHLFELGEGVGISSFSANKHNETKVAASGGETRSGFGTNSTTATRPPARSEV